MAEIGAALDTLAELDVVQGYHHGPDAGLVEGNWDYAVVAEFATVDDYRAYATDTGHLDVIERLIKPNISARAATQYHLDG